MAHSGGLDEALHQHADQTYHPNKAIEKFNEIVCYFISELKRKKMKNNINVIILGIQGTEMVRYTEIIELDKIFKDENQCTFTAMGTNPIVTPTKDQFGSVYRTLKDQAGNKYRVFK